MVTVTVAIASGAGAAPRRLPAVAFQDQEGRVLDLGSLRGRVAVIVYGGRTGLDHHLAWGRRLDAELRARGVYGHGEPLATRPVRILAVAQMGGIPGAFREMLRAFIRPHVEAGHSLWLDWDNALSTAFGGRDGDSTVLVADRAGEVQLVVGGLPEGDAYRTVSETLKRIE
jgi:hypothetical protein